jgi:hypothetical protein
MWPIAFDPVFKDIRRNFSDLNLKLRYLSLLQKFWSGNVQFCVFTDMCPDISMDCSEDEFKNRRGIYELPIETSHEIPPQTSHEIPPQTTTTTITHSIPLPINKKHVYYDYFNANGNKGLYPYKLKEGGIGFSDETGSNTSLSAFVKKMCLNNHFHVIITQSCRCTKSSRLSIRDLGVPFTSEKDPSLFSLMFDKFNKRYLRPEVHENRCTPTGGAITYKYNHNHAICIKKHLKNGSLDVYTNSGNTHKCKDGKVRTLYSKGKYLYVKMKDDGHDGKYEYKRVKV